MRAHIEESEEGRKDIFQRVRALTTMCQIERPIFYENIKRKKKEIHGGVSVINGRNSVYDAFLSEPGLRNLRQKCVIIALIARNMRS